MTNAARYEPIGHPGWIGRFTTDTYPGALPNGSRIVKRVQEKGDAHPVGTGGLVLGSMGHPEIGWGYFVEWDTLPRHAVFVDARKVEAVKTP